MLHYGFGFGFFPFFPLLWILFWVLIIAFFFRGFRRGGYSWHDRQSADEILRERFARGEIDEKEYQGRLAVLKKNTK